MRRLSRGYQSRADVQRRYDSILRESARLNPATVPDLPEPSLKRLPPDAIVIIAFHDETRGPMTLQLPGDEKPFEIPLDWHEAARNILSPRDQDTLRKHRVGNAFAAQERERLASVMAKVDAGEITTIAELERACLAALAPVAEDVA